MNPRHSAGSRNSWPPLGLPELGVSVWGPGCPSGLPRSLPRPAQTGARECLRAGLDGAEPPGAGPPSRRHVALCIPPLPLEAGRSRVLQVRGLGVLTPRTRQTHREARQSPRSPGLVTAGFQAQTALKKPLGMGRDS